MVLDDAETIARQARRRAALRRRRREGVQRLAAGVVFAALVAVVLGAPLDVVGLAILLVGLAFAGAMHLLRERQQQVRVRRTRAQPGVGIGAPRPAGGFTTCRHRSGAPLWVERDDATTPRVQRAA